METLPIVVEGYELAPAQFYLTQMQCTIDMFGRGHTAALGLPILSFFTGVEQQQPFAEIFTGHIDVFLEDKSMQREIERAPFLYIEWVETIFFYFREMAAFPELASSIWERCWLTLNMLEQGNSTLAARSQMAGWAAVYDQKFAVIARDYIKCMTISSQENEATRSLILSTDINKGQDDFQWHVKNALKHSPALPHIQKLQAWINYYCQIDASREILCNIISVLNWGELQYYRNGKLDLLRPVVWIMQKNNNYEDLLFLLRCLKLDIRQEDFKTSHAFVLPNMSEKFTALKKCENIKFTARDNGKSYVELMQLCNQLNGVAISILGEEELGADVRDYDDFGIPSREGGFEDLRRTTVVHYHLEDDFYRELNLLTLVPSHNHPVQGALCSLGHIPPLLSTSLEDIVDEDDARRFVFFLASSTYTYEIELRWLRGRFGEKAIIHIDPTPELLLSTLNDEQFTHIYISAHGKYDHWERDMAKIHFSDVAEVSIEELKGTRKTWKRRRTLILNICDGAASRLSYNPNNSGLAATLASGAQVVISHLWPVNPKYAACFGLLLLDRIDTGTHLLGEAVLDVYKSLSQPNNQIAELIRGIGSYSEELSSMVTNTDFEISDFRNIGSVAIYA